MTDNEKQLKLFAMAVYEIRVLLSHRIGARSEPLSESLAANLAYCLHNEALAVLDGRNVDVDAAIARLKKLDETFQDNLQERFIKGMSLEEKT